MLRSALLMGALAVAVAGCTNYYHVKDPTTGRNYYTRMIWDKPGGGISFEDTVTGHDVTLQNSEVSKITSRQYDAVARHRIVHDEEGWYYPRPAGGTIGPDREVKP